MCRSGSDGPGIRPLSIDNSFCLFAAVRSRHQDPSGTVAKSFHPRYPCTKFLKVLGGL